MSKIYRGMLFQNECRFYLTKANDLIEELNSHTTYSPTAICALGRSVMITNILGIMQKDDATITTIIEGGGPIGTIVTTSNTKGEVKSKVSNPLANPQKINNTKLNVGGAVGNNGYLRVIKDLNLKEPFVGDVPLINGEIGIDFANYFALSEQIPTAIAVGVLVDTDHSIKNASCFLVQVMPEASEDTISKLENFFNNLESISHEMLDKNEEEFLEENFKNDYEILETINTTFKCDCSYDKFLDALKMLAPKDIIELKQDKTVECICDFCYKKYDIITQDI